MKWVLKSVFSSSEVGKFCLVSICSNFATTSLICPPIIFTHCSGIWSLRILFNFLCGWAQLLIILWSLSELFTALSFSVCKSMLVSDRFEIIVFICKTCFSVLIICSVRFLILFFKASFSEFDWDLREMKTQILKHVVLFITGIGYKFFDLIQRRGVPVRWVWISGSFWEIGIKGAGAAAAISECVLHLRHEALVVLSFIFSWVFIINPFFGFSEKNLDVDVLTLKLRDKFLVLRIEDPYSTHLVQGLGTQQWVTDK